MHAFHVLNREQLFAENQRLKAELQAQQKAFADRHKTVQERDARVTQLELQLDYFKRKLFGTGKSEKLDARQCELILCEIDYIEAEFFRRQILRPKFRRKDDRSRPLVVAPTKPRVVEGLASDNLLALIMVSNFVDHLPQHRQAKIYKRHGCDFPPAAWFAGSARWAIGSNRFMTTWLGSCCREIICKAMTYHEVRRWQSHEGVSSAGAPLAAKRTNPGSILRPRLGIKENKAGYYCVYSVPGGHVVFVWRKGRKSADVTGFLSGFQGLLQAANRCLRA